MAFLSTIVTLAGRETLLDQCHELNLGEIERGWDGSGVGHVLGQRPATSRLEFQVLFLGELREKTIVCF